MGESAKRLKEFVPRAIRYVIRPEDNRVIRHSKQKYRQRSYHSDILNVSETGLLFTIDRSELLKIGEQVLVEFQGPALNKVATHAKVVRTDRFEEWHPTWGKRKKYTVAIQFVDIPEGLSFEIRQGIKDKIQDQIKIKRREQKKARVSWIVSNKSETIKFALATFGWLLTLQLFFSSKVIIHYLIQWIS